MIGEQLLVANAILATGTRGVRAGRTALGLAASGLAASGLAVSGLAGLGLLAALGGALAQDGKAAAPDARGAVLKLELNRLEPAGEACRTYLLVDNSRGPALKSLKVDLFAFDTDGVAQKRLAVELGPVQDRKTMVRLFDFPALACPKIGRVLLNDVLACEGGEASRETCLDRIETDSKTSAAFVR